MAGTVAGVNLDFNDGTYARRVVLVDPSGNALLTASGLPVQGNIAHDAVDAGNPVEIGGYAKAAAPAAVSADADRVRAWFTLLGQLGIFPTSANGAALWPNAADMSGGVGRTNPLTMLAALQMADDGSNLLPYRMPSVVQEVTALAITSGTPQTAYTPTSGKKWRLLGYALGVSATGLLQFKYGAGSTQFAHTPVMTANVPYPLPWPGLGPRGLQPSALAANDVLKLDANASLTVNGYLLLGED